MKQLVNEAVNFVVDLLLGTVVLLIIMSIAGASEPPQCNLPGWGVVAKKTTTQTVFATRAPIGHTHTCVNGHTWDHQANPSHKCQYCGAVQYVQDRSPRPVTVTRTVVVDAPAPSALPPARAVQQNTSFYILPRSSAGGCANGQCAYPR